MPSGKIVVSGGQAVEDDETTENDETEWITDLPYEVNPSVTNLQAPWVAPGSFDYDLENYPFMYPVSASELFFAGGERREQNGVHDKYLTFVFDTSATSLGDGRSPLGGYSETWHGTPVMYRPGLILKTGGVEDIGDDFNVDDKEATTHTEKVDVSSLTQPTQWQYAASMHDERIDHDLCTLADGRVMAMGGTLYHGKTLRENSDNWVESAEIWDPTTNIWTLVAPIAPLGGHSLIFRGYHSLCMLLPDGRVLLAGGDVGWPNEFLDQPASGQLYMPDYDAGTRPEIVSGPDEIGIGSQTNQVVVNDSGCTKACLIGLASVSHSFETNARYIQLTLSGGGTTKTFAGPVSTTQAPPGYYMLFVQKVVGARLQPCQMAKYVRVVSAGF
jgi:hypothetical protein